MSYGVIYCWTSPSGKRYHGLTTNFPQRKRQHESDTRRGSKLAFHNALRKYGLDGTWEIVMECDSPAMLGLWEDILIQNFSRAPMGYNLKGGGSGSVKPLRCRTCGSTRHADFQLGYKSECKSCNNARWREERRASSIARLGYAMGDMPHLCDCGETDPEKFLGYEKACCRECRRARDVVRVRASGVLPASEAFTPERRAAISARLTGRTVSQETRDKLSVSNTGNRHSPETLEKMRIISTGRKMSEETKRKMSASQLARGMARPPACPCGEDDPEKFKDSMKSECRACYCVRRNAEFRAVSGGYPLGKRPHLCKDCGEDDPEKFRPKDKGRCRACYRARTRASGR